MSPLASHGWALCTSLQCAHRMSVELSESALGDSSDAKSPTQRTRVLPSSQFKYTSAMHTDLGNTFARIKGQLKGQSEEDGANVYSLPKSAQMHSRANPKL